MFRTLPRLAAAAFVSVLFASAAVTPAAAEENTVPTTMARVTFTAVDLMAPAAPPSNAAVLFPATAASVSVERARPVLSPRPGLGEFTHSRRPSLLPALYAANIALQALDAHSTMTAIGAGAREANPVMQGVVGNRTALLAVKAGAAAGTIYFAEKLWRRNPVGAVVMMAVVNGVSAAIVAHNYQVAREMR